MAREPITREKPDLAAHPGGLDEFLPRERVVKEVEDSNSLAGWSLDRKPKTFSGTRPTRFEVPDNREEVLIKFLQPKPFAGIYQHWIQTKEGRRPYKCLETNDCPLCSAGDRAKVVDHHNVIVMGKTPEHQVWYASADPAKAIKERAESKRTAPINRDDLYFAVAKSKSASGFNTFTVDPVKVEELESDWGISPLTDAQIEEFEKTLYTDEIVRKFTKAELAAVVRDNFE